MKNDKKEYPKIFKIFSSNLNTKNDLLFKIPDSMMLIYSFETPYEKKYFDTDKDLVKYIKNNDTNFAKISTIEYIVNVADRSDVIKETYIDGTFLLFTAIDEDGYEIYNNDISNYKNEFVWEYEYGNIGSMYSAFRDRGIVFQNDIYAKIEEKNKNKIKKLREISSIYRR